MKYQFVVIARGSSRDNLQIESRHLTKDSAEKRASELYNAGWYSSRVESIERANQIIADDLKTEIL